MATAATTALPSFPALDWTLDRLRQRGASQDTANTMKQWQNVAIAQAGLYVFQQKTSSASQRDELMLRAFKGHAKLVASRYHAFMPAWLDEPTMLLRSYSSVGKTVQEAYIAKQLWETYRSCKAYCLNDFGPEWSTYALVRFLCACSRLLAMHGLLRH